MIMHTSIFLPSTTVPWSRSRARSASALFANVTKPNPCMQTDKTCIKTAKTRAMTWWLTLDDMRLQASVRRLNKLHVKPSPVHWSPPSYIHYTRSNWERARATVARRTRQQRHVTVRRCNKLVHGHRLWVGKCLKVTWRNAQIYVGHNIVILRMTHGEGKLWKMRLQYK